MIGIETALFAARDVLEVRVRAGVVVVELREPGLGLAEAVRRVLEELVDVELVVLDLLLEERREDGSADSSRLELAKRVDLARQGRCGGDDRAPKMEAEVRRGEVDAHDSSSGSCSISASCSYTCQRSSTSCCARAASSAASAGRARASIAKRASRDVNSESGSFGARESSLNGCSPAWECRGS